MGEPHRGQLNPKVRSAGRTICSEADVIRDACPAIRTGRVPVPRHDRRDRSGDIRREQPKAAALAHGDEGRNSIRTPLSELPQAQIDRYRKYRQPSAGSYQATNHVRNREIDDLLDAMDSMACRKTTACRDKWGEQWSSNRVHRAEHVDNCQRRGRGAVSRSTVNHIKRKEKKNAVNQKTKGGSVGIRGNPTQKSIKSKMRDGAAAPSPTKGKEAGPRQCHSQLRPRQNKEALKVKTCLRPWTQEDAR